MKATHPPLSWDHRDLFFGLLQGLCLLCAGLQVFIDSSTENLSCVAMVAASSCLLFHYLWRSGATVDYPLSSLAMLGLCVSTQYAALIAQTSGWISFIHLLKWPVTTFSVLATVQVVAVASHWTYKNLAAPNTASALTCRHVLTPMGAMSAPPVHALWIMAVLGGYALSKGMVVATGDVGGKAFQAVNFMAYMPFLIPLYYRRHGAGYCNIKVHGPALLAYAGLMIVIAMARNARQYMVIGPLQVALIFLVYLLQNPQPITRRTLTRLTALAIGAVIAVLAMTDLATAMLLTREKRDTVGSVELVKETLMALTDRDKLAERRQSDMDQATYKRYDEAYLSNPMLARFSETKFHDNHIQDATVMSRMEKADLENLTRDKLLAILPQPILDAMDIKLDKDVLAFSFGDFYRYLNEGPEGTLGGFATGSVWAHIIGLFGLDWFPVITALIFLPSFMLLDCFNRRGGNFDIAPVMMCSTWVIFSFALGGESLAFKVNFYLRDLPQKLIIYVLVLGAIKHGLNLVMPPARLSSPRAEP